MTIYDDPNVLVVHLKRFDGFLGGKISGHVAFGEGLDLSPFLSCRRRAARRWQRRCGAAAAAAHGGGGGGGGECKGCAAAGGEGGGGDVGRPLYRLHGVLVHSGLGATSGHYYSYVRDGLQPMSGWHCANDSSMYRRAPPTPLGVAPTPGVLGVGGGGEGCRGRLSSKSVCTSSHAHTDTGA
jgi:ubiquitin carboxyl-terminal hydrolase 36/42